MKISCRQFPSLLRVVSLLAISCSVSTKTILAEDSLDFDVDQLIANEKAWSTESESSTFSTRLIEVTVIGANSNTGLVHIFAYDDAQAFRSGDYQSAVGYLKTNASTEPLTASISVASKDKVALFAYHDENSDEVLNKRNQIPEEAYGFSGGVNPYLQPTFADASFTKDSITIRLVSMPQR